MIVLSENRASYRCDVCGYSNYVGCDLRVPTECPKCIDKANRARYNLLGKFYRHEHKYADPGTTVPVEGGTRAKVTAIDIAVTEGGNTVWYTLKGKEGQYLWNGDALEMQKIG